MNDNNNNRKNTWGAILPYLFIALVLVLLVTIDGGAEVGPASAAKIFRQHNENEILFICHFGFEVAVGG